MAPSDMKMKKAKMTIRVAFNVVLSVNLGVSGNGFSEGSNFNYHLF